MLKTSEQQHMDLVDSSILYDGMHVYMLSKSCFAICVNFFGGNLAYAIKNV